MPMATSFTDSLQITAWPDPVIDRVGHEPSSAYFEWLWLPRVGPSAAWAYRRLASGLVAQPEGDRVSLEELAHWLGLGRGTGANSIVVRTLRHLTVFHLAIQVDDSTLGLRWKVPPLTQSQVRGLSPHLQRTHLHLTGASTSREPAARAS